MIDKFKRHFGDSCNSITYDGFSEFDINDIFKKLNYYNKHVYL